MEKEALISALKEKSQVDNLSERTIDEVATMFLPTFADDEKITDDTWVLPLQMVKTMSGQLRHDLSGGISAFKNQFETENKAAQEKAIAEAVAAAKAEWEIARQGQEPPKPGPDKNVDLEAKIAEAVAKATGEQTKAFETLSKQFSDYMKQVAEEKRVLAVTNVREQIRNFLIDLGVEEDDYALEICLEKLEIGEKPDVEALKTKAKTDYEAIYKRMHKGDSSSPLHGGGGGGGSDSNTEFEKFIKEREAAAAQEAKDAAALKESMM